MLLQPVELPARGRLGFVGGAGQILPNDHVSVIPRLPARNQRSAARHVQACDQVVVPAQKRLVVRVLELRDDDAAAEDVDDRFAVRMHVQRLRRVPVEADRVLELHGAAVGSTGDWGVCALALCLLQRRRTLRTVTRLGCNEKPAGGDG